MATRGIDLSQVSLQDALDLAVLVEDEAKERYDELAAQMEQHRTPGAALFFRYMSMNEARHGAELRARRQQLFGDNAPTVTRAMIFDVEAPDYDVARAFMTPREAMAAALASEEKAHAFFVDALNSVENAGVRALFIELCADEVIHQNLVKTEIAKLPAEPAIAADAYADEPAAQ